jgi:hypothetical protein
MIDAEEMMMIVNITNVIEQTTTKDVIEQTTTKDVIEQMTTNDATNLTETKPKLMNTDVNVYPDIYTIKID